MSLQSYYSNLPSNLSYYRDRVVDNISLYSHNHPIISSYIISYLTLQCIKKLYKLYKSILSNNTVLELILDNIEITEHPKNKFMPSSNKLTLLNILEILQSASNNPKIKGLVLKLGNFKIAGISQIQELRNAINKFKKSGKYTVAYADSFGELSTSWYMYYLASVCDRVYMSPSGQIGINGLLMTQPFLKNAFAKLDIEPLLEKRKNYKTAANMFMKDSMDPYHEEMITDIATTIWSEVAAALSDSRSIYNEKAMGLINDGPYSAYEGVANNLLDGICYYNQVCDNITDIILNKANPTFNEDVKPAEKSIYNFFFPKPVATLLYVNKYYTYVGRTESLRKGKKVAVITLTGSITTGKSEQGFLENNATTIGSDTVCLTLRSLIKKPEYAAVLIRIDSRGGSYTGSEHIFKAILDLRKAGKKVICSMSNFAASGGYFIAMSCDWIVTAPLCLTGSIGVVAGKFNLSGFLNKFGVTMGEVKTSEQATFFSNMHNYSGEQPKMLNKIVDFIYEDFTSKVASSRKLEIEKVEIAAQGRVWLGEKAKSLGLIDEVGGYMEAIEAVKRILNVKEIELINFPVASFESLFKAAPENSTQELASVSIYSLLSLFYVSLFSNKYSGVMDILSKPMSSAQMMNTAHILIGNLNKNTEMVQASISEDIAFGYQSLTGSF